MKIIGVASSPRVGRVTEEELSKVLLSNDINAAIHEIGYQGKVSNSEALLLAAMWGAHKEGAGVELVYPGDTLPDKYEGIVLSTPVYFGDRSSDLHNFITVTDSKMYARP